MDNIWGDKEVPDRATSHDLSHAHPMLAVADVEAAIDYYRSVLGFFVEFAIRDESGATTIANLWRGSLSLFLMCNDRFGPSSIYCHLKNRAEVDALYRDLLDAGAEITEPPSDRPWGNYELWFDDPDGNRFRFASAAKENGEGD